MNKAIKKAIVNVLLTATAGSLIIFVLLSLLFESGGPATTAEPATTEIEKVEKIKAAEADQRFYFTNMPEIESPFELILFDAEIKAAGKRLKSLLPPDSSEDRIRKVKMIYDYMKEMAPAREKGVLLELAAAAVKYAEATRSRSVWSWVSCRRNRTSTRRRCRTWGLRTDAGDVEHT